MSIYEEKILPHIINCACSSAPMMELRREVVPYAVGDVLEVGMGSAVNLSLYDTAKVNRVWGLEPSEGMRQRAQNNLQQATVQVDWIDLPGEKIPLEDNSVDTVLLTFTLCTIPDWLTALKQMKRVLKPDGQLLFLEHGEAPDPSVLKWQNRLNPYWNKLFGGCNLNRPTDQCLEKAGFEIEELNKRYVEGGPKFASYMYSGRAVLSH